MKAQDTSRLRGPQMSLAKDIEPTDTCARCGLRRATREFEAKGVSIRLCDDCYWGREPAERSNDDAPAA